MEMQMEPKLCRMLVADLPAIRFLYIVVNACAQAARCYRQVSQPHFPFSLKMDHFGWNNNFPGGNINSAL